jgi:hypothetical protein
VATTARVSKEQGAPKALADELKSVEDDLLYLESLAPAETRAAPRAPTAGPSALRAKLEAATETVRGGKSLDEWLANATWANGLNDAADAARDVLPERGPGSAPPTYAETRKAIREKLSEADTAARGAEEMSSPLTAPSAAEKEADTYGKAWREAAACSIRKG